MPETNFRAMCEELLEALEYEEGGAATGKWAMLRVKAGAALDQPEPTEPTDEELLKTYCDARRAFYFEHAAGDSPKEDRKAATIWGLRAALARWGTSANNTREENLEVSND
jgi:hypothetical protein